MKPTWARSVFCFVAYLVFGSSASSAEPNVPELQGFWFGDGKHPLSRNVLLVQNDEFVVISPLGRFTSTFVSGDVADGLTTIDIDRYDGKRQLGVYIVDATKLYLKLAAPGDPRPTRRDVTFPNGKPHWHTVFDRRPTQDGLEVLGKKLQGDIGSRKILNTRHQELLPRVPSVSWLSPVHRW